MYVSACAYKCNIYVYMYMYKYIYICYGPLTTTSLTSQWIPTSPMML